ncbi:hypothetical protein L228DRAFT_266868 [Xylona heveae TC161]|uniref:F-box domain-containing protein n=1 Tax=Xylona heveae (strain CBS 132557 / TC161) TaxID=1328760 RepID=A0A165I8K1_XYLHT|nr:hypothetical protein L228DRAFT_266868 [Xylona heveae TC161]KZF24540.1 hypothetical protein L228DRAFT_266868 [Xylona heveae TC161]
MKRIALRFRRASGGPWNIENEEVQIQNSNVQKQRHASLPVILTGVRRTSKTETEINENGSNASQITFAERFLALPTELQLMILYSLSFADLMTVRLLSRRFSNLVAANETPLARHHIKHELPPYIFETYSPTSIPLEMSYLRGLAHHHAVVKRLASNLAGFITREIFGLSRERKLIRFESRRRRMQERMIPRLLPLLHFFESYSVAYRDHCTDLFRNGQAWRPPTSLEAQIMDAYSPATLLKAHEMCRLLFQIFSRKLRPPTYAGTIERTLRRWTMQPGTRREVAVLFALGGLEEVLHILEADSYVGRRRALAEFVRRIDEAAKPGGGKLVAQLDLFQRVKAENHGATETATGGDGDEMRKPTAEALTGVPGSPQILSMMLEHLPIDPYIWFNTAESMLIAKGAVKSLNEVKWPPVLINDLVGYNFLHEAVRLDEELVNDDVVDNGDEEAGSPVPGESGDEIQESQTLTLVPFSTSVSHPQVSSPASLLARVPTASSVPFSLAHFCEVHGPTSILCTQVLPVSCVTCSPPESSSPGSDSVLLASNPGAPSSSTGNEGRHSRRSTNTTNSCPSSVPTHIAARRPGPPSTTGTTDSQSSEPYLYPHAPLGANASATTTAASSPSLPFSESPPRSPLSPNIHNHPFFVGGYTDGDSARRSSLAGHDEDACANCSLSLPKKVSEQLPEGAPGSPSKDGKGQNGSPVLRSREAVLACGGHAECDEDLEGHNSFDSEEGIDSSPSSIQASTSSLGSHTHTLTYLTTRHPPDPSAYSLLRRSCIRALSCENLPRGTPSGPISFGDPIAGYTIAFVFRLPDPRARGRRRSYAFLALGGRDGRRVFRALPEITKAFAAMAARVIAMAERTAEREISREKTTVEGGYSKNVTSVSSFLSGRSVDPDGYPRRAKDVRAKGLAELVGKEDIFVDLHVQFVQLLARLGRDFGGLPPPEAVMDSGIRGEVGELGSSYRGRAGAGVGAGTSQKARETAQGHAERLAGVSLTESSQQNSPVAMHTHPHFALRGSPATAVASPSSMDTTPRHQIAV